MLPGGVAGIKLLSDHILVLGTTRGDGIGSANGAFTVPDKVLSSAMPVLEDT